MKKYVMPEYRPKLKFLWKTERGMAPTETNRDTVRNGKQVDYQTSVNQDFTEGLSLERKRQPRKEVCRSEFNSYGRCSNLADAPFEDRKSNRQTLTDEGR